MTASRTRTASAAASTAVAPTSGYYYLYVFPRTWEDHCKLGFSGDPLSRIQALHPRYYEFFDLDQGWLVETETQRDARDLELQLRRRLVVHNAPAPLTARRQAGGHTEWYRGAEHTLGEAIAVLQQRGHVVHRPLRPWLRTALCTRSDQLYAWTLAQLSPELLQSPQVNTAPLARLVRDSLDAYPAMGIDVTPLLPPEIARWYGREPS